MTELIRDENGLALTDGKLKLRADFKESLPRLKNGAVQSELLVKAARMKGLTHPCVLDATAGLGQDSILLAAAGFTVELYEYDPVIAALLQDALKRAAALPPGGQHFGHAADEGRPDVSKSAGDRCRPARSHVSGAPEKCPGKEKIPAASAAGTSVRQ